MYRSFHDEVTRSEGKSPIWAIVAGAVAGASVVALVNQSSTFHYAAAAVPATSIAAQTQVTGYQSQSEFNTLRTIQSASQADSSDFSQEVLRMSGNSSLLMGISGGLLLIAGALFNLLRKPVHGTVPSLPPLGTVVVPASQQVVRLVTGLADKHTSVALMAVTAEKKVVGIRSPVFNETCDQTGITLSRFMLEVARANPDLQELESVFASIQTACKTISKLVKRSAIDGMTGLQAGGGAVNVQGEEQKKLDVITNEVLKRALKFTGRMGVIASEEEDVPVEVDNTVDESYGKDVLVEESGGRYISVFDPLDGSSNVDAGIPVGTIFGIFQEDEDCTLAKNQFDDSTDISEAMKGCLMSTLKPGSSLVAAGYALYSSATHFVFTLGAGVNGFTLDESIGEFILTHPNIKIPPRGKIYSINEANRNKWDGPVQEFIHGLVTGNNRGKKAYSSRYIGSMVGDVHRTMLYGGVFGYPSDTKSPNGKLRLLYEAAPMSFLIEQAGGKSTTGLVRVMDIPPKTVHQRVPLMMGGADEIDELIELYNAKADAALKKSQLDRLVV
eukprot:GGOE01062019.1.p1 GENE.GGOE01062019.1~~GGOE01062019.1.p1  ORF type:complete len:557 (+),score=130.41 GGOE01062019.1:23-1693(+)